MFDGRWGIAHGNDNPEGTSLQTVVDYFVLTDVAPTKFFDEHETMLLVDVMTIRWALQGGI